MRGGANVGRGVLSTRRGDDQGVAEQPSRTNKICVERLFLHRKAPSSSAEGVEGTRGQGRPVPRVADERRFRRSLLRDTTQEQKEALFLPGYVVEGPSRLQPIRLGRGCQLHGSLARTAKADQARGYINLGPERTGDGSVVRKERGEDPLSSPKRCSSEVLLGEGSRGDARLP